MQDSTHMCLLVEKLTQVLLRMQQCICDAADQKGTLQGKSVWSFVFDVLELYLHLRMTPLVKIDQIIQILQLKKDRKFLFSLLFYECFHPYPENPTAAVPPFSVLHHIVI